MVIHEVLNAGDNILVAQELLKNSLETLVKYADNDYRVQFKHHLLIANTLSEVIGKLEPEVPNSKILTPFQLLVKDSKLSLKEISEATGIGYSTLGNYNQGTRIPNAKNAQILSDYFGVSIPYLLGIDDNSNFISPTLNDSLEKIMVIHEVLNAGDNILVAQELLKNSLETLVKYADNDYRVQFKHHLLIANTLSEVIGKLDKVTDYDKLNILTKNNK